MEFQNADIAREHERWWKELSNENGAFDSCVICLTDVLDAHFSIVDFFIGERGGEKAVGGSDLAM